MLLIGYSYWINGFKEKSEYYFNTGLEHLNEIFELGRQTAQDIYLLAGIYAYMGDKEKAYEYLRLYNQRHTPLLYMIKNFKYNPLFDSIRGEPEFQQFMQEVESKYQAEHEKVRQWLEENEML